MDNHKDEKIINNYNNKRDNNFALIFMVIGVVVLVGVGSFIGGFQVGKSSNSDSSSGQSGFSGQFDNQQSGQGGPNGGMGRMGNFGTVTAISSDSITIKITRPGNMSDDSSFRSTTKAYTISSSTKITEDSSTKTTSDISTGDTVMIQTDSSDSSTASTISINPTMGGRN